VLTTGAGAVEGVTALAARKGLTLAGLEVAVRDVDDPVGNVRRIDAAARAAELDVPLFVELPGPATSRWLAAADEVAACGHRLKLRLGNVDHRLIPDPGTVAGWIDAALDRETRFKCTAGLHRAVRHDPEGGGAHGFWRPPRCCGTAARPRRRPTSSTTATGSPSPRSTCPPPDAGSPRSARAR
jgi:hypothetical protein